MVKISSWAFIFFAIFSLNHAAPDGNSYWLNPPEGGAAPPQFTWMVGEQQNLSWFTLSRQTYNISLVQEVVPSSNDRVANVYGSTITVEDLTSLVWTVQLYQFDLSVSNLFFFWVNIYKSDAAASAYFNISNNQSGSSSATSTSTLGLATATATSLPSSTATTLPSSTTLSSRAPISTIQSLASSSSSSPVPNGISIGAKESLGIALGVGIPVITGILAIMFVLFKRVKSKGPQESQKRNLKDISKSPYLLHQTMKPPVEINGDSTHRVEIAGYRSSHAELPANT